MKRFKTKAVFCTTVLLLICFGFKKEEVNTLCKLNLPHSENTCNYPQSMPSVDFVSPFVLLAAPAYSEIDTNNTAKKRTNEGVKPAKVSSPILIADPRDGQIYKIMQIGNQTWFAENLRYGIALPQVFDSVTWNGLTSAAWCYYQNDSLNNSAYGKLYNWYAVNATELCPAGWHVPKRDEWEMFNASLANPRVLSASSFCKAVAVVF